MFSFFYCLPYNTLYHLRETGHMESSVLLSLSASCFIWINSIRYKSTMKIIQPVIEFCHEGGVFFWFQKQWLFHGGFLGHPYIWYLKS